MYGATLSVFRNDLIDLGPASYDEQRLESQDRSDNASPYAQGDRSVVRFLFTRWMCFAVEGVPYLF